MISLHFNTSLIQSLKKTFLKVHSWNVQSTPYILLNVLFWTWYFSALGTAGNPYGNQIQQIRWIINLNNFSVKKIKSKNHHVFLSWRNHLQKNVCNVIVQTMLCITKNRYYMWIDFWKDFLESDFSIEKRETGICRQRPQESHREAVFGQERDYRD